MCFSLSDNCAVCAAAPPSYGRQQGMLKQTWAWATQPLTLCRCHWARTPGHCCLTRHTAPATAARQAHEACAAGQHVALWVHVNTYADICTSLAGATPWLMVAGPAVTVSTNKHRTHPQAFMVYAKDCWEATCRQHLLLWSWRLSRNQRHTLTCSSGCRPLVTASGPLGLSTGLHQSPSLPAPCNRTMYARTHQCTELTPLRHTSAAAHTALSQASQAQPFESDNAKA